MKRTANSPPPRELERQRRALLGLLAVALVAMIHCDGEVPLTAPAAAELVMSANPTAIPAENGQSVITVLGFKGPDDGGGTLADGTQIFFATTVGVIEERVAMNNGVARATLRSNGQSGEATVTARSGNITAGDAGVMVNIGASGTGFTILVTANPASLGPFDFTSEITATVTDVNNNTVAEVPIVFSTDAGQLASAGAILRTNQNGQAFDRLTLLDTATDSATVTASSGSAMPGTATVTRAMFPAPIIDSVFPSTGSPGSTASITITGQNFQAGATASFGVGISINRVDFVNAETLVANITIDGSASGDKSVIVTNPDGNTDELTAAFSVGVGSGSMPPLCDLQVGPFFGGDGTIAMPFLLPGAVPANFSAAGSTDPDGTIVSYAWDFGDGVTATTATATISHLYAASGTYPATVLATDNAGATCSVTIYVDEP